MKKLYLTLMASALAGLAAAEGASLTLSVKPERSVILKGSAPETVIQVELKADDAQKKRTTPINLALVLDRSGSMAGAKLEKAKQAAGVALDQLGPDDFFSVVIYDDEAEVLIAPQKVGDKEALKNLIQTIKEGGSTALYADVEKGASQLRKYFDKEKVNRIILLSDGLANVGPSSVEDLSKLGQELRAENLSVSTIGLGDDYNEDLMTALAEASNANYYYVQDAEKLPDIFRTELGTVKSMAARNVSVTVTLPQGVKPNGVIGESNLTFSGQTIRIPLDEFFSSQTRRFLISCQPVRNADKEIELARVELTYDDAIDGNPAKDVRTVKVRQSDDAREVDKSVEPDVTSQVAIIQNRLAKEKAVKLADSGRAKDAATILRNQAAINAGLPETAQSDLLKNDDAVLKATAGELESAGSLTRSSRKNIQYQNYQDKVQQQR